MSYTFRWTVLHQFNSNNPINSMKLMQFLICSKFPTFIHAYCFKNIAHFAFQILVSDVRRYTSNFNSVSA